MRSQSHFAMFSAVGFSPPKSIVDDMVVELVHDLLDLGEIHDHAIVVERVILHRDRNDPVVSMEIRTLAFIVQVQEMRTGYFDSVSLL